MVLVATSWEVSLCRRTPSRLSLPFGAGIVALLKNIVPSSRQRHIKELVRSPRAKPPCLLHIVFNQPQAIPILPLSLQPRPHGSPKRVAPGSRPSANTAAPAARPYHTSSLRHISFRNVDIVRRKAVHWLRLACYGLFSRPVLTHSAHRYHLVSDNKLRASLVQ